MRLCVKLYQQRTVECAFSIYVVDSPLDVLYLFIADYTIR